MNNLCWRGPLARTSPYSAIQPADDVTWPELQNPKRRRARKVWTGNLSKEQFFLTRDESLKQNAELERVDQGEFPSLGHRMPKRKFSCGQSSQPNAEKLEFGQLKISEDEDKFAKKVLKKPRRTDLISIDLQKALERQRSFSESQACSSAKSRFRVRNVNVNITVRNPLDGSRPVQTVKRGKQREIPKSKRTSKLRQVILKERELKRQMNVRRRKLFELEKICAMTRGLSGIDFDKLKITSDPKIDKDFVKDMSTMNLFSKDYRKTRSDDVPEETPEPKADVTKKLQDLLIGNSDVEDDTRERTRNTIEQETDPIDHDIIDKTLCLKICDETGETIEEYVDTIRPEIIAPSCGKAESQIKHSKSFREYCTNMLTPALNTGMEKFLAEITRLQRKLYDRDEVRGRCKRRFYAGLKEVEKHVELRKVKFVVVAPDLERIQSEGGLDESQQKLIGACKKHEVVFCFALNRRKLGYLTHKKGCGSCVGIADYSGAEGLYKDVLVELVQARNAYRTLNGEPEKILDPTKLDLDTLLSDCIGSLAKILIVTN